MPDLRTLLDQAAGNPPDLPNLAAIRERGQALKTRNRLGWGLGAAAASVLLAAGVSVAVQQSDRDTMPAPQPAHSQARTPVRNACAVQPSRPSDVIAYTASRTDSTSAVHLMSPDGSGVRCLVDTAGPDTWPVWSPDGQWIAFIGGDGHQEDLFVVRADGSELTRLTDTDRIKTHPVWAPDGTRLGFSASRGGEAHRPSTSCSAMEVVTWPSLLDLVGPSLQDWSPDGTTLLFTRGGSAGGDGALWSMAPDGSQRRLLRSADGDFGSGAQYSPDGTRIAFQADLDGGCIYVSAPDAQRLTRLTTGCNQGGSLSWAPDGIRIVTAGGSHGPRNAEIITARRANQVPVTVAEGASYVDWRPATTR